VGTDPKVFRGIGVMVTQVLSDTLLSVKAIVDQAQGAYVARPAFTVDLTKTVSQGFDAALYDDRGVDEDNESLPAYRDASVLKLGITSIGSSTKKGMNDMRIGAFVGGLYVLAEGPNGYGQLRDAGMIGTDQAPWPPSGMDLYQYTSVAYPDGRRYHGFHAKLVSKSGTKATMVLKGIAGWQTNQIVVDLADPKQCDPAPPGAATNGASSMLAAAKAGDEGAIFLALNFAVANGAPAQKLPSGQGG